MLAIRHIFEYLNGVPHTIWFDNDSALVKIENLEHGRIRRIIGDTFNRFKLHYDFNEFNKTLLTKSSELLKENIIY